MILLLMNTAIEAVFFAADAGLIGSRYWRPAAFQIGAFWIPILDGGPAFYPGQRLAMFVTYAFLHGGLLHYAMNMLALVTFGTAIVRRAGVAPFLAVYGLSAIGGAACFAVISTAAAPMIGASGALFGLLGAWMCWDWQDRRASGRPIGPVLRIFAYLLAYNLAAWLVLSGGLAWEAHLGGFVAGWLFAQGYGRPPDRSRPRRRRRIHGRGSMTE